jgi:hypothetical protein
LSRAEEIPEIEDVVRMCKQARENLIQATMHFAGEASKGNFAKAVLYATPYQELFGDVAVGFMLLWQAEVACRGLGDIYAEKRADSLEERNQVTKTNSRAAFYVGKIASARFFAGNILALSSGKADAIINGDLTALEVPGESLT